MDPPPIKLSLPPNLTLEPSFHPLVPFYSSFSSVSSENFPISNYEANSVWKKKRKRKWSLGGIPSASDLYAKGKIQTHGHHVWKKLVNGYHPKYRPLDIMLGRGPPTGIIHIIYFLNFNLFVSSSLKNKFDYLSLLLQFFVV